MKILNFKKIITIGLMSVFVFGCFSSFALAACSSTPSATDICFDNPLDPDTVDEALTSILNYLQGIIVVISMVFIVIGALLYMTSAGNESRMTTAKGAIFAAVIGLAIGIAAPSFLKEIYAALGTSSTNSAVSAAPSLATIALNVLNFLLGITGVIGIIMLVAAGIGYLTAAGNEGQIETAKKMTKWAIIGIAVALGALVIVKQVASFF
ncbi:MAG: hypothetical protein RBS77_02395 [Candidatus Moranbacteria bacterium]|jgi:hypothetical protein|nr:hypothetical protein [Candidatus Moranbacteria bacterium]